VCTQGAFVTIAGLPTQYCSSPLEPSRGAMHTSASSRHAFSVDLDLQVAQSSACFVSERACRASLDGSAFGLCLDRAF